MSPDIPFGFCHCGCGQSTDIATYTRTSMGIVKGQPYRYLHGHSTRKDAKTVMCPTCNQSFQIKPSRQQIYCSHLCEGRSRITSPITRFWDKTQKTNTCWLWIGAHKKRGYGVISIRINGHPHNIHAHRLSWIIHYGTIPDGMDVCHHCDTPACVRPDHLFLGDAAMNMADAKAKGRIRNGPEWP